jgi:L-ribulose-5-phosphate 3-epimerase
MRNLIDDFKSPYIGAYLDVGNVVISGYPEHWIDILGSLTKMVHLHPMGPGPEEQREMA